MNKWMNDDDMNNEWLNDDGWYDDEWIMMINE